MRGSFCMKYIICFVLLVILGSLLGIYMFRYYIKPDIEDLNRKIFKEHPEYFKAPEAKRLGKSLQNSL